MQQVLEDRRDAPARVLVVWEPVLWTDMGPPTSAVMARIPDPRVMQFWDEKRLVSTRMLQALRRRGDPSGESDVAWDLAALYAPGVVWEDSIPDADFVGGNVCDVAGEIRARLAPSAARAKK